MVSGGDIIGTCYENTLFDEHRIMIPPRSRGKVTYIAPEGNYNINEEILSIEFDGKSEKISMSHWWPVR